MIKFFFLVFISCASFETEKISSSEKFVFTPLNMDLNKVNFKENYEEISYEFSEYNFEFPFNEELKAELKNFWRNERFKEKKNASILIETKLIPNEKEFLIKQILKSKKTNKIFYNLDLVLNLSDSKKEKFYFYQTKNKISPINQFNPNKININMKLKKEEIISILEKSIFIKVDFFSSESLTDIFLDEKKIGNTPIFNYKLKKGFHKISARRKGEKYFTETILLQNEKTILEFGKENDSILEILSFPKNEKIILNHKKSILTNHIELNLNSGKNFIEFFKENQKNFEMNFELKKNEFKKILYIVNENNIFNIGKENFYYSKEPLSFDERLIFDKGIQVLETSWIVPSSQFIKVDFFSGIELNSSEIFFSLFNEKDVLTLRYSKDSILFFKNSILEKKIRLKDNKDDVELKILLVSSNIYISFANQEVFRTSFNQKDFYKIQIKSDSKDETYSKAIKKIEINSL